MSFEIFRKTNKEKENLANAKHSHNKELKANGFNPKKRINLSSPQFLTSKI